MTAFLSGHFRYPTMNYWNNSTSYANNIKIHSLGLPDGIRDKLYGISETAEFWEKARRLFDDFAGNYDYRWQIGTNGRSGGYLVLYSGSAEPSKYKSYCTVCGQPNYTAVADGWNICGKCRKPGRVNYLTPSVNIYVHPGKPVDMNEDFSDRTMQVLQDRVRLVQDFDRTTDGLLALAVGMCKDYEVKDEVYYTPHTRKTLVERHASDAFFGGN
jgi:hypothetical protein